MIEVSQIAAACQCTVLRAVNWREAIDSALRAFDIGTPARAAAFLAQIAHESGRLCYVVEIWGPTVAQKRYEGRADLGNLQPGDGYRYRGRGLIQITGRSNYVAVRDGLRLAMPEAPDFEDQPQALEVPKWAVCSAGWFWKSHELNHLADEGDFERITKRINGGTNGYEDRLALWVGAKAALGVH